MNASAAKQIEDRAEEQARAQIDDIVKMVTALSAAGDDDAAYDAAEQAIHDAVLSVEVRTFWHAPGVLGEKPTQFRILLCWGGPSVQIVGDLNEYGQPFNPIVQYQDWGTLWTDYRDITDEQNAALLTYCRCFCFRQ